MASLPGGTDSRASPDKAAMTWRLSTWKVTPRFRSASVSPTQSMADSPPRSAALSLLATRPSSSPAARRSECPTKAQVAEAMRAKSAEVSPVWAPEGSGCRSWTPNSARQPARLAALARSDNRTEGGKTTDRTALTGQAAILET